jgi:hypothetical protein
MTQLGERLRAKVATTIIPKMNEPGKIYHFKNIIPQTEDEIIAPITISPAKNAQTFPLCPLRCCGNELSSISFFSIAVICVVAVKISIQLRIYGGIGCIF